MDWVQEAVKHAVFLLITECGKLPGGEWQDVVALPKSTAHINPIIRPLEAGSSTVHLCDRNLSLLKMNARDVHDQEESVRRDCERLRESFRRHKAASLAARSSNSVDRSHSNSLQAQKVSAGTRNDATVARDPHRNPDLPADMDERLARTAAWVDRNSDSNNLPNPKPSSSSGAVPIHTGPSKMQDPSYGVLHGLVSSQQTRPQHCLNR